MIKTVALAGLGAIGLPLARALDEGIDGLKLVAVSARDLVKARARLAGFRDPPALVDFPDLAEADIVVEATPAALFERVAIPAIEAGRIFIPASVGALLPRMHLVKRAKQTGARIVIPTGALLGLDAVRAAAEGRIESITIETRKPPAGLLGAPYLQKHGIDMLDVTLPVRVFAGNARDAALGFPANVNVAAALSLSPASARVRTARSKSGPILGLPATCTSLRSKRRPRDSPCGSRMCRATTTREPARSRRCRCSLACEASSRR